MIFRYRLFLRWWMVGGSLKRCLTQFVPEGTLPRHFVTWGCKHSRGPTPLSKHAILWHLDFGELTDPRNFGRHYIYFHLWGLRLLEEDTRGPSLKQEAPRLWDKTSHHLNYSQRMEILKEMLSCAIPCQGYCHLCKQAVKIILTYHGPKNPDHRIPEFRVKNTEPDKLRLCHLWMKMKN